MSISLNPAMQKRKFELTNTIAILSLVSSIPLTNQMTPEQQNAVLGDKLNSLLAVNGASGTDEFLTATTDAILNPSGYTNIVTAVMDILTKLDSQSPSVTQSKNNVLSVSPNGGDYSTINDAINAIGADLFGIPAANNVCLIQVYPGIYTENIILPDFINIVGENLNSVVVIGTVTRETLSSGIITNLTIRSDASATFSVTSEGEYMLHGLKIENFGGGTALLLDNENAVISTNGLELKSSNGVALMLSSGKVVSKNTFFVGLNMSSNSKPC